MADDNREHFIEKLAQPCRNFNILTSVRLIDPLDQKEKVVLSNFTAGGVGNLIFLDPVTGEGESLPLPGDSGAWALLYLQHEGHEKLLVGTCPGYGYLHSLDLNTRTWAEPLRCEGELYIWNLVLGSDGFVYGGTYPGCALLRYDPNGHKLEHVGRASNHPENLYSRIVYGDVPGKILISGGFDTSFLMAWDIESGQQTLIAEGKGEDWFYVHRVTENHILVKSGEQWTNYDTDQFRPLNMAPEVDESFQGALKDGTGKEWKLQNQRSFAVRGQEYVISDRDQTDFRPIPTHAPATAIHTITSDEQGNIWGSSGFGQTIFCYDPKSGNYENTLTVCDHGGEVYGMQFVKEKLYMTAYAGGDHIVYQPDQPWNQRENLNPKTIKTISPDYIRPSGKSIIGPDGAVWTGWTARYGVYGGAITRIDPDTEEVSLWEGPVAGQRVIGLTSDERYLYVMTDGGGNGLPEKEEPGQLSILTIDGSTVTQHEMKPNHSIGAVLAFRGNVLIREGKSLLVFDPKSNTFVHSIEIRKPCHCLIAYDEDTVAAFCEDALYWIDCRDWTVRKGPGLPGAVRTAAVTPAGELYFAIGNWLYRMSSGETD